ncbi:hypothetical protein SH2C18_18060 [Clostridium sediminicola]|uniref:hypothetical protein n=1 Tax=Clostridium sediminicola TaxID=3114879 RepID=UPI0031F2118F
MKKNHIILSIVMISTLLVGGCGKAKPTNNTSTSNKTLSTIEKVNESKTNSTEDTNSNTIETDINDTVDINTESNSTNESGTSNENNETSSKIIAESHQSFEDLSNILDDLDNALDDINDSTETETLINNSLN